MRRATPPPVPGRRSALAFALVLVVGLAGTLANPALLRWPQDNLRDGSWARAYQAALDQASPLRPTAVALWNAIDLTLFRQAPEGVVLGADGWLFTAEEYALPPDPEALRAAAAARVRAIDQRLAADGVRLVVALVPAKAALVDVGQPPLPRAAAERYDGLLVALRGAGVEAVDLRPALSAMGDDAWLRTDTHWTPAGASAAAEAVAEHLRALLPDLAGAAPAHLEVLGREPHRGDLVELLELGNLAAWVAPEPDALERTRLVRPPPAGSDLFAPVALPLAIVGTSYAADARWRVSDRLEVALSVEVLDAAAIGDGPFGPMEAYLQGPAYLEGRPRAVVWEIPERYLDDPTFVTENAGQDASPASAGPAWRRW
jgi:alginate O-acetyltransferase complex protein AlgJ